jgi:transposase
MIQYSTTPQRFIGLDVHRDYFVAAGVNAQQVTVFGPQRVPNHQLPTWIQKHLTTDDAVVLEMTTNTYLFYDLLKPHVHSVIAVHPPHVALITRAQVKTDRKAALGLAQLHAAGLLVGVWIPPQEVRDLRALLAQRHKMVRLQTQAKNRLHSALFRHALQPPDRADPFTPNCRTWWEQLPVSELERINVLNDLDTLQFAQSQIAHLTEWVRQIAIKDERVPLLVQLPGINLLGAITLLAAIGDITRFEGAKQLVGYAGLGTRVHDSGQLHTSGRITKTGRRDIRRIVVEAAQSAVRSHPHWKAELARLEPRIGREKAIVAIGRKLLVAVWHVLTDHEADRFAEPTNVACSFFALAYKVRVKNLPDGLSALAFTRQQLDRLQIGADLQRIPWGSKTFKLPPSKLKA